MTRTMVAVLALALLGGVATAQNVEKGSSSTVVKKVVISKDGETKTYKQVIKDGKVVEESGDRSLLGELDIEGLIEKARKHGGDSKKRSRSRRVVIKDGKKVIDEETGDLDWDELELPENVEKMLKKLELGEFEFDVDVRIPKINIPHIRIPNIQLDEFHGEMPEHVKKMLENLEIDIPAIKIPKIEIDALHGEMPENVRKMLENLEIDIPAIKIPKIELDEVHGALPDHVKKTLEDLKVDVPEIRVDRLRPSKESKGSLEKELEELRAKMRDLRKEIQRLERRGR